MPEQFFQEVELEAERAVEEMMEETCEVDEVSSGPADEVCIDGEERIRFRTTVKSFIRKTLNLMIGSASSKTGPIDDRVDEAYLSEGEVLEKGWEARANSSALIRNAEVWKVALQCVFRVLKTRKLKVQGATNAEIAAAQTAAAEFVRDNLLKLGPSFVKLVRQLASKSS
jgi:hypothetical protein